MTPYTIHTGDEFDGDECYSVLKGPNGFKCWLTEPEDRNWYRDGFKVVNKLNEYESIVMKQRAEIEQLKAQLAESEKAAYDVAGTIDGMKAQLATANDKIFDFEAGCP